MKLGEMADLLSGLATSLERFMGKAAVSDLHEVSECFRKFSDDNVKAFCAFVEKAKEGKSPVSKSKSVDHEAVVAEHAGKIRHALDHLDDYDYAALQQLIDSIQKLPNAAIKAIGDKIGCPVSGTKPQMISRLQDWLLNIKRSTRQATFV